MCIYIKAYAGILEVDLIQFETLFKTLSIHFKTSAALQVLTIFYICVLETL